MRKVFLALVALLACTQAGALKPEPDKHPVSPFAATIEVFRVNEVLFRYIVFDLAREYPCLRFETYVPINLQLISRKDVCDVETPDGEMLDPYDGVAHLEYLDFRMDEDTLRYRASIIKLRGGDLELDCHVRLGGAGKLTGPICEYAPDQAE